MTTRRISVADVLEAYRTTGLKPERGHAHVTQKKCCPIGALGLIAGVHERDRYGWADRKFGNEYVNGFLAGFDETNSSASRDEQTESAIGFRDGIAAATAVFGGTP